MSWATALYCAGGALIVIGGFLAWLEIHLTKRRDAREFRITPKYTVGSDCK